MNYNYTVKIYIPVHSYKIIVNELMSVYTCNHVRCMCIRAYITIIMKSTKVQTSAEMLEYLD